MSFSSDCKKECTLVTAQKSCCELSELCGLYCGCGSLSLLGLGKFNAQLQSESMAVSRRAFTLVQRVLGQSPQIHYVTRSRFGGRRSCVLTLGPLLTPKLMRAFRMLQEDESGQFTIRSAAPRLPLSRLCCKKAFLRGLFMGAGTVSPPGGNYHLELKASDSAQRDMAARSLQALGIPVHISERKKGACFYIKRFDEITAFLTAVGASGSVLQLEEAKLRSTVYSSVKRSIRCDEANLSRQLSASQHQSEGIRAYLAVHPLSSLPPALREIAEARLQNPEANYAELGERMDPPLGKSAVNHRLRRLAEITDEYISSTDNDTPDSDSGKGT